MHLPDPTRIATDPKPAEYPRVYPVTLAWRIFLVGFGAALVLLGLAGAVYLAIAQPNLAIVLGLAAGIAGLAALGVYCVLGGLKSRVILDVDAITLQGALRRRQLRRDAIAGRRIIRSGNPATLQLIPRTGMGKKLNIALMYRTDAAFHAWLAPIHDLDLEAALRDAEAMRRSEAAMLADPRLGATPEIRAARLARARSIAMVLNGAALLAAAWGFLDPRPYKIVIAILAALPLLAFAGALGFPRFIRLSGPKTDARRSLSPLFVAPGIVLGLRALIDIAPLDWLQALGMSAASAALLGTACATVDPGLRSRATGIGVAILLAAPYAFGALMLGNVLPDQIPAQYFEVPVQAKRAESGKYRSWHLKVGPWGPRREAEEVTVTRDLYDRAVVGEPVCVYLKPGLLGIPWYVPLACPPR